jgi:transcription elongation factor Elf1
MSRYNIKCPLCGAMNMNVDMDETGGWMVCDKCKQKVGIPQYMKDLDMLYAIGVAINQASLTEENKKAN